MTKRTKNIAAVILIIGGIAFLGYHYFQTPEIKIHSFKVAQDVKIDSLQSISLNEPIQNKDAEIMAIFTLKSGICPPCVNNTFDYIHLLEAENPGIAISALFFEQKRQKADRFMQVTRLPIPYRITNKVNLPGPLSFSQQQLLFIDTRKNQIIYRVPIPGNVTTGLDYKKQVLEEALSSF